MNRVCLRLDAEIVIAGVVPSTVIQAGHMVPGRKTCQRGRPLRVAIKMIMVNRSHQRVVRMAQPMPHSIAIVHAHVTHLHRQEVFDRRLPNTSFEYSLANLERIRPLGSVSDNVGPSLRNVAEVELKIMEPHERSPVFRLVLSDDGQPICGRAVEDHRLDFHIVPIEFNHRDLRLLWMIAHL